MGFAPQDEDFRHHPEKLSGVCVWLLQPPGPGTGHGKGRFAQENAGNPGDFIFVCLLLPVVVHVADEHGVEGVEVPAEHGKLIQDEQLRFLVVAFTVSLQQLLFSNDLRLQQFTVTQL